MTPQSIVLNSVSHTRATLQLILTGLPEDAATQKAHPTMLSIAEAVAHLSECYIAFAAHLKGEEHQWGSFQSHATTFTEAIEELFTIRDTVTAHITPEADEATLKSALDYLTSHDWYHIGQIATNRQVFEPGWSSYSIYYG